MPKRIILDVDPGIDDALAILLALASPELQIEAITVVSGNTPVRQGLVNTLFVLDAACAPEITAARGAESPLVRLLQTAGSTHGPTGLGYARPAVSARPVVTQHAANLIVDLVMASPGEITLVALGPLTNIALALRLQPQIAGEVAGLVVMGGTVQEPGNTNPLAEFNFHTDPHAAKIVLHSGMPIVQVGLDVTRKALFRSEHLAKVLATASPVSDLVADATHFYMERHRRSVGLDGCALHDPLALASVAVPDLLTTQKVYVDIETTSELTMGQLVADFRGLSDKEPNVDVAVGVDTERFMAMFLERIAALSERVGGIDRCG